MATGRLLRNPPRPATENMAVDAVLLAAQRDDPLPTLRLYEWDGRALTFGYFQEIDALVDLDACRRQGVQLARRPTGGGVVVHDGSMTFSLVVPRPMVHVPESIAEVYCRFAETIVDALARFGVSADVASKGNPDAATMPDWCLLRPVAGDVLVEGRKIAGGAMRQTPSARLYQAYLFLSPPSDGILAVAKPKPISSDLPRFTTTIREVTGNAVTAAEVGDAFVEAFSAVLDVAFTEEALSAEEEARVATAVRNIYGRRAWLFGNRQSRRRLRRRFEGSG